MRAFFLIPFIFIIVSLVSAFVHSSSSSDASLPAAVPNNQAIIQSSSSDGSVSANNSELSPTHAIWAPENGTLVFIEIPLKKIWEFSSGPAVDPSYRQLPYHSEDFEIKFRVDKFGKLILYRNGQVGGVSADKFFMATPFVSASGGVVLASKKTTLFIVDVETGKVINTFTSDNNTYSVGNEETSETSVMTTKDAKEWLLPTPPELDAAEKTLIIIRTDYNVKYFNQKTGQLLWHLTFADIEAFYHLEGVSSFFGRFPQMDLDPIINQSRLRILRLLRESVKPSIIGGRSQDVLAGDSQLSLPGHPFIFFKGEESLTEEAFIYDRSAIDTMSGLFDLQYSNGNELVPIGYHSGTEEIKAKSVTSSSETQQSESFRGLQILFWILGALAAVVTSVYFYVRNTYKPSENLKVQNPIPKKRKVRKAGTNKQSSSVGNKLDISSQTDVSSSSGGLENDDIASGFLSPKFSDDNDIFADKRKIGKLTVFNKEIAKGSNGTIVLEGNYDGRAVAVKRLVRTHHDVAVKEIKNLIASDQHPNIVRWYGVEIDPDFVYLSLERCACSLYELITFCASENYISDGRSQYDESPFPTTVDFQLLAGTKKMELWRFNGYPSAVLLKIMRDIVCGVAHLHELGIVHRDLKPQNVLIIKDRPLSAKISDMGISKRLDGNMTSLTKNATGSGTSGWQAPEQLRQERQTRAVDLFSLGCILFFCLTGGKHPFGESIERDVNIVGDQKDLFLIDNIPEATNLISRLLDSNPQLRPSAMEVSYHPLFWNSEMRLSFLRDVSDRVELEDRENSSELLESLENCGNIALGGKWDEKMDAAFINDIGRYRRYKYDSVRDLLRVIRNKLNHFRELSKDIQGILGPVPEGFDHYFSTRFPKLLIEVYKVTLMYCAEEEIFRKYFRSSIHL